MPGSRTLFTIIVSTFRKKGSVKEGGMVVLLGKILLEKGYCDKEQLLDALLAQAEATPESRRRLGEMLVAAGICTKEQIEDALEYQRKLGY